MTDATVQDERSHHATEYSNPIRIVDSLFTPEHSFNADCPAGETAGPVR